MTAISEMSCRCRKFLTVIARFYRCSARFIPGAFCLLFFLTRALATSAQEKVDLLITGGTVITMDAQRRVLDDGAIAASGDSIVAVGSRAEIETKFQAAKVINAHGAIVMP